MSVERILKKKNWNKSNDWFLYEMQHCAKISYESEKFLKMKLEPTLF